MILAVTILIGALIGLVLYRRYKKPKANNKIPKEQMKFIKEHQEEDSLELLDNLNHSFYVVYRSSDDAWLYWQLPERAKQNVEGEVNK